MAPDARSAIPPLDADPIPFHVCVDLVGGTVAVSGELDRESASRVLEGLSALAGTGHQRWALDAAQVVFCDAAGLRALVTAHHLARRHGSTLVLERPSPCLHRLLLLVGLDQMLELRPAGPAAPPAAGGHRPLPSAGPLRAGYPIRAVPSRI